MDIVGIKAVCPFDGSDKDANDVVGIDAKVWWVVRVMGKMSSLVVG